MRIAWFTPLSRLSAIGRFSVAVTASLSKLADVDLCCFDAGELQDAAVNVKRFRSHSAIGTSILSSYDFVIYNFGNYLPFHQEIYSLSQCRPGVCILHDFVMHHFFAAYYLEHLRDPGAYRSMLERVYDKAAPVAQRVWETDDVVRFPLFEEVVRGSLGVITHSSFFRERVEKAFAGPVTRIPLAYDAQRSPTVISRAQLGIRDDQILAVTVGHVNPNKQVDCVIQAIGQLGSISKSLVYAVLGPIAADYERRLKQIVREHSAGSKVLLLGQVSDEILCAYLTSADICINLRYPAMEGASASAIEEMLFGKPVIVTNTGFFSELPSDCVVKVEPRNETQLVQALKALASDRGGRTALGARARTFAESEFHPDRYAREVTEFLWSVQSTKPILDVSDRVGVELWRMGAQPHMSIVDDVTREMVELFGAKPFKTGEK